MTIAGEAQTVEQKPLGWLLKTIIITNFSVAMLLVGAYWKFGSIEMALARLRGERLVMDSTVKSIGPMDLGETRNVFVRMTNVSSRPVTILGGISSCTCTFARGLPRTILPHEKASLEIRVKPQRPGDFSERISCYTDDPAQAV